MSGKTTNLLEAYRSLVAIRAIFLVADKMEQLILSGDFFQLPPVPEQDSTTIIPSTFAFDALSWSRCIDEPVSLTKVFRQKDNSGCMILHEVSGYLTDK